MKKFTLMIFIFFLGVVVAIFGYGFLFSNSNQNLIQNDIPTVDQNNTSNDKPVTIPKDKPNTTSVTLTTGEVAKHATKADCYLIINKKVYKVSSFIDSHPGGAQRIISNCGTEVTGIFAAIHSNFAWDLLKKYYIGNLGQTIVVSQNTTKNTNSTTTANNASKNVLNNSTNIRNAEEDD